MSNKNCEREGCPEVSWHPYSRRFCPMHFAEFGERSWVRSRFCGVLNGYTPATGDVKWDTHWPREDLVKAAESVGIRLDSVKEVQWRNAQAVVASRYPYRWEKARHRETHSGPGSRMAVSNSRATHLIEANYDDERKSR